MNVTKDHLIEVINTEITFGMECGAGYLKAITYNPYDRYTRVYVDKELAKEYDNIDEAILVYNQIGGV